jgi:hypothetical protein
MVVAPNSQEAAMAQATPTTTERVNEPEAAVEARIEPSRAGERLETREWLGGRIGKELSLVVAVSWYVLFFVGTALEPKPTNPDAIPAWLTVGVDVVLLSLLGVMTAGLLAKRRWGLVASMGAAGVFLAASIACPVSGHHAFGAWWYGQMACALGLVGITGAALRRS